MLSNFLKIALRNLYKNRGYNLINILSLAIGLTAFMVIATYIRHELSFDRFHSDLDRKYRILQLEPDDPTQGIVRAGAPWGPALQADYPEIEQYTRIINFGRALFRVGDEAQYETGGILADSNFFQFFSYDLIEGDKDQVLTRPFTIVISEQMASRYFGASPAIGKNIRIDGDNYEVVGVMDEIPANSHLEFRFVASFDSHSDWFKTYFGINNYWVYLQLREATHAGDLEQKFPEFFERHDPDNDNERRIVKLQPISTIHLRSDYDREFMQNGSLQTVLILSGIAILLLVIACVNFLNLATARGIRRAREIGVRKTIGARRRQLVLQFLSESMGTTCIAFILSLTGVALLLPVFNSQYGLDLSMPFLSDWAFSSFLLVIVVATGILAGIYPALFLSSFKPVDVLKGQLFRLPSGVWMRKGLVVFQFVLSIGLIASTGVILQQLRYLENKDLGFNKEQIMVVPIPNDDVLMEFELVQNELERHPAVRAITGASGVMGGGDWGMPLTYEGGEEPFQGRVMAVDEAYFDAYEMDIVQGRPFSPTLGEGQTAFILNETAARSIGWEDPIGKWMARPTGQNESGGWNYLRGRVVGVVKDYHYRSLHEPIDPLTLIWAPEYMNLKFVKIGSGEVDEIVEHSRNIWESAISDYPFNYYFLDEIFTRMYASESRLSQLFELFALLAIVVACLGLFGLAAYHLQRRVKELGIRKILGASTQLLIVMLSKEFLRLVLIAFLIAAPLAWYFMADWLNNFAYRIDFPVVVFVVSGLLALGIAWLAIGYHAIRASRANPVKSLRCE